MRLLKKYIVIFLNGFYNIGRNASNKTVLGETRRFTLFVTRMESYRYPHQCYLMSKQLDDNGKINWMTRVRNLLFHVDFQMHG